MPGILTRQYATDLKARVRIWAIGICEATFWMPSLQYTVIYSLIVREASPHLPPRRFASRPRQDKPVRKYTSSTSKGRVSSLTMNCSRSGSQYPISSCSREVSDLIDEIWKYFSSLHCIKALTMLGWLSASFSAPSCSRSHHSITIRSRPVSKHPNFIISPLFTEKCLQKALFWCTHEPFWPVPTCTCSIARDPLCVGPFTCTGSLRGPHVRRADPMEPCYSSQKSKNLETSMK